MTTSPGEADDDTESAYTDVQIHDSELPQDLRPENDLDPGDNAGSGPTEDTGGAEAGGADPGGAAPGGGDQAGPEAGRPDTGGAEAGGADPGGADTGPADTGAPGA